MSSNLDAAVVLDPPLRGMVYKRIQSSKSKVINVYWRKSKKFANDFQKLLLMGYVVGVKEPIKTE